MLEVFSLDPRNCFSVVNDLCPWLHKCIEDDITVKVDDGNSREPVSLLRENSLAVDRQSLGLSACIRVNNG